MAGFFRLLASCALLCNVALGFGFGADSFHMIQSAVSSFGHHASYAHHASLVHHASHQHASLGHKASDQAMDLLKMYKNQLAKHPLPTKMMTGATLAVAGDAIAQSQDPSAPYDKKRAASFGVFDTAYRALQHYSFPVLVQNCHGNVLAGVLATLSFLPHVDQNYLAAMEQTLGSQLGIVPFLYYPAFFALTAAVQGLDFDGAVVRAQENFIPLMKRNLLFWIPVQFVQFAYVPTELQIPFLSACGLAWTFILSVHAGSAKSYDSQQQPEPVLVDPAEEILAFNQEEAADDLVVEAPQVLEPATTPAR